MHLARVLIPVLGLAFYLPLEAAVPSYFITTAAGLVPPLANPMAAKQYLNTVTAVAYDAKGNLYYANSNQIWRLNPDGTDTLIAGIPVPSTQSNGDGGAATSAPLPAIVAMSFDAAQNLYVAQAPASQLSDAAQGLISVIRKIATDQNISTVITLPLYTSAMGLAVDGAGNIYIDEFTVGLNTNSSSVVMYPTEGGSAVVADNLINVGLVAIGGSFLYFEDLNGLHQRNLQTGATAILSSLLTTLGLAAASDGTAYFGGAVNGVEKMSPTGDSITLVAGWGLDADTGDGGLASAAQVTPNAMAVNPLTGDLAIGGDFVVRVISGSTGVVQTVAGTPHSAGDNGPAALAQVGAIANGPVGNLASDSAGNVYFFDYAGNRIRKLSTAGIITTVAGSGVVGNSGDGGKATDAAINAPDYSGVASDGQGDLFFLNGSIPYVSVNSTAVQSTAYSIRKKWTARATSARWPEVERRRYRTASRR